MKSFCTYYNQGICRSCDLITSDYSAQLSVKETALEKALQGLSHPPFQSTETSPLQHFRNKAKFVITGTSEHPVIGLAGEKDPDHGRELMNCLLHVKEINDALPYVQEFIRLANLTPYEVSSRKGELKGIILFHSEETGEMYLRFVLRSKESIDRIRKHKDFLLIKLPNLKSITVNIQPIPHAVLEGEEEISITDTSNIRHKAGNVTLSLGTRAFVQTNQSVAAKLYATAADWAKSSGTEKFMELFCGQGAFSFFAAPYIRTGLGIEINPEAVKVANSTAESAGLTHLKFKSADASKVMAEIENFDPDLLLVNPPRRGLGGAEELILKALPQRMIYSSCNYETLASDLLKLKDHYEILKIKIFDMFPHTSHFETLVELKRKP